MQPIARWRPLVSRYELRPRVTSPPSWGALVEGRELALEVVPVSAQAVAVNVALALGPAWSTLSLTSTQHAFEVDRVLTGDPIFDAAVIVRCDDLTVLGLFDADGRERVAALIALGVRVHGGVLHVDDWATRELAHDALPPLIDRCMALARALSTRVEARVRRLAEIAQTDLVAEVRVRFAGLRGHPSLREAFARHTAVSASVDDEAFETLRQHVVDTTLATELRVASLGRLIEAFPLARLAPTLARVEPSILCARIDRLRRAMNRSSDDREVAVRVLNTLATLDPAAALLAHECVSLAHALGTSAHPDAAQGLGRLAAHRDRAVRIAALEGLVALPIGGQAQLGALPRNMIASLVAIILEVARRKAPLGAPLVAASLPHLDPRNNVLVAGALNILAESGDPSVAPAVVAYLESPLEDVVVAAIGALGEVGALSEVARLSPLGEGFFRAGAIKGAAKAAIARLRERHRAQALPGAVSLTDDTTGALSALDPTRPPDT